MLRELSAMFVVMGLLFAVPQPQAHAQATRAYAPENLRSLSRSDQERVIGLEYSEQANGRRIPDDQLRFYLDQVNRSNWSFSQIKQDIATSLRGNQGGWNPGPGIPSGSVLCESENNRYRECRTNFRGNAVLTQNVSKTRCVEGENWGSRDGMVWVDRGCKGRFAQGSSAGGGTVRCESKDNRRTTCHTGWRSATLTRQLSRNQCVQGQSWGMRNGAIWVDRGCRAEFVASRGGQRPGNSGQNNYSVTCSSDDNRTRTCNWERRAGRPILVEQLSRTRCVENRNWGWNGDTLWVSQGCRARFASR